MNYKTIKRNYEKGLWNESLVKMAVRKGVLTQAECDAILSGDESDLAMAEDYIAALAELGVNVE